MSSKHIYERLCKVYPREFLMKISAQNGVTWEDTEDEGVNWLRCSTSLKNFLEGNKLDLDLSNEESLSKMSELYQELLDIHKQTMIPHVRAVTEKVKEENSTAKFTEELLPKSYELLEEYGGDYWNEKLSTLNYLASKVNQINQKLGKGTED